jgi:ADP-ribose pyrophosphatase
MDGIKISCGGKPADQNLEIWSCLPSFGGNMEKWKRLESRIIHQDKWISLRVDKCELPNGRIIEPFYVVEQKDSVHVVAIDSLGRVLTTRQYRHAGDSICTEIPCGVIEAGEAPLVAGQRELQEETGHIARDWIPIISPFANPARFTNRIHCFLARDVTETGIRSLDDTEEIEFEWLAEAEVKRKIFAGEFSQALHIAAVFAAWDYLRSQA